MKTCFSFYSGNGRLRHAGGAYTDWEASPWVNILSMDRFFKLDKGVVTIQENGLYYVYAQVNNMKKKETKLCFNSATIYRFSTMTITIQMDSLYNIILNPSFNAPQWHIHSNVWPKVILVSQVALHIYVMVIPFIWTIWEIIGIPCLSRRKAFSD